MNVLPETDGRYQGCAAGSGGLLNVKPSLCAFLKPPLPDLSKKHAFDFTPDLVQVFAGHAELFGKLHK